MAEPTHEEYATQPTRCYEIGNKLGELFVDGDMLVWLFSPQKLLNDAVPAQLLLDGKIDEVERLLDQILEGAYI